MLRCMLKLLNRRLCALEPPSNQIFKQVRREIRMVTSPAGKNTAEFYTGNPNYYIFLKMCNDHLRLNGLLEAELPAVDNCGSKWLNRKDIYSIYNARMNASQYNDMVKKLNLLDTIENKDKNLKFFLDGFNMDNKGVCLTEVLTPSNEVPLEMDDGVVYSFGKRKHTTARVWMSFGTGEVYVNTVPMTEYFRLLEDRLQIAYPFDFTNTFGKYNTWALVTDESKGSSASAAIALAIFKNLKQRSPYLDALITHAKLDIPDPRTKERIKTNKLGARKSRTWVKR